MSEVQAAAKTEQIYFFKNKSVNIKTMPDGNDFINISDFIDSIIMGDCLEVMKRMPDKSIDVIITSPPYNLLNSTGNGLKKIRTAANGKTRR